MPDFIFATCQIGAEAALKAEAARTRPELRFAYSRPGFLTFKVLESASGTAKQHDSSARLTPPLAAAVFVRSSGFSLGKVTDPAIDERAAHVWRESASIPLQGLHVWRRDLVDPDFRGRIVEPPPSVDDVKQAIERAAPDGMSNLDGFRPHDPTRPNDLVLDCVIIEPDEWWIGYHRADRLESCWPGGLFQRDLPPDAVSRAWLKMEEALAWSGLPIGIGDVCAEIGSAPGGSSQALLGHGAQVIGIDPADMDPLVLAHPGFIHWKKRGADVRRREFRKVRWLMADINVAPQYTLDTVEAIVTHAEVNVQGMLLTLKLLEWSLAAEIPAYLDRIRNWGFSRVIARQLHHNRREICVAAERRRR